MDDRSDSQGLSPLARVAYKGDAAHSAQAIYDAMKGPLTDQLGPLEELASRSTQLGVGTVLITIVAIAAFKATLKIAIDAIEATVERLKSQLGDAPSLQIELKLPDKSRKRFPTAVPAAIVGEYSWKVGFETIRELISAL